MFGQIADKQDAVGVVNRCKRDEDDIGDGNDGENCKLYFLHSASCISFENIANFQIADKQDAVGVVNRSTHDEDGNDETSLQASKLCQFKTLPTQ